MIDFLVFVAFVLVPGYVQSYGPFLFASAAVAFVASLSARSHD